MYELLIFDWDGTLIDSEGRIVSSMQAAAVDVGVTVPEYGAVRNIIGLGLPEAICALFEQAQADAGLLNQLRERYAHHFLHEDPTQVHLFPQVRETLMRLHQGGYRLAVATGKSRKGLDRALRDTELGELFEITRCADETCSKPDPHMLDEIIWMTDVAREHSLMIGDTEYDLEMGQRAGIATVAVSYGAHEVERLQRWSPLRLIDQFVELEQWLQGLSRS